MEICAARPGRTATPPATLVPSPAAGKARRFFWHLEALEFRPSRMCFPSHALGCNRCGRRCDLSGLGQSWNRNASSSKSH
eukprot:11820966-Alexandrium_andersonii.AAC.1